MNQIAILCVEDEPEVRDAVMRDLAPFDGHFRIECAEDVEDARLVISECEASGDPVGLILCDHLLPGTRGVDFLIALSGERPEDPVRKVLLTGQAGHDDTIRAINQAHLHHYIAKPWTPEDLHEVVRDQLTHYVIATPGDLMPYLAILDAPRLLDVIAHRQSDR
jgi:two-component system chemotaxis response regulator CheY